MKSTHRVHQYQRVDIGVKEPHEVMKCVLPGCRHYLALKLAEGKESRCNLCDNLILLKLNTKRVISKKPICDACSDKKGGHREAFDDAMDELMKGVK